MKIVVDSGIDLCMTPKQISEMGIHQVPLSDAPIDVKHFEQYAVCLCREGY